MSRCGWKAVVVMGADRSRRKPEYGSKLDTGFPLLMLKILTRCFWVPLQHCQHVYQTSHMTQTYVANTGACSWTLSVRRWSVVACIVFTLRSIRMSHSLTSPLRQPLTSSRCPPRCRCTFVIHCLCSFQTFTMAVAGFWRWSYTRMAPSPKPATKTSPSTWSDVNEVMQDPDRAGMSYESQSLNQLRQW